MASGSNKLTGIGYHFKLKIKLTNLGRALLRKSHTIKLIAKGALVFPPA